MKYHNYPLYKYIVLVVFYEIAGSRSNMGVRVWEGGVMTIIIAMLTIISTEITLSHHYVKILLLNILPSMFSYRNKISQSYYKMQSTVVACFFGTHQDHL